MGEKKRGEERNARKREFPKCYGIPGRSRLPYLAGEVQEVGTEEGARAVAEPNMEIGTTNISQHNFVLRIVRSV